MADFKATFKGNESATFRAEFTESDSTFTANFGALQCIITGDYNALANKPQINDVEVIHNKTLEDYGVFNLTNQEIKDIFDRVFNGG